MENIYYNHNKLIKNLSGTFELDSFLKCLMDRYKVHFNFHDLCGMSTMDQKYASIFYPYLYHNNTFCNYVKKSEQGFLKCIMQKYTLCNLCLNRKAPFYGRCYMGVEEFVFPVICQNSVIALICVGQFAEDNEKSILRVKRASSSIGLNTEEAIEKFREVTCKVKFSFNEFYQDMEILCHYLSLLYLNYINEGIFHSSLCHETNGTIQKYKNNFIVNNTINYINNNYNKELSLSVLAANSFCNESYLSHIFKEKIHMSLIDYINRIRIENAKHLLDITSKSVTEIGMQVGFNDSGYFSKIFKNQNGVGPKEYRKRNIIK